jgi:hypothetical protein
MARPVFRIVLPLVPPTCNSPSSSGPKERLKELVRTILGARPAVTVFANNDRLYGRICYFNHDTKSPRDIHNILKPLFDALEGFVYHDDKQIKHFEGFRMDMEHNDSCFELELDLSGEPDLVRVFSGTTCFVEICELPSSLESLVIVKWLD